MVRVVISIAMLALLAQAREFVDLDRPYNPSVEIPKGPINEHLTEVDCKTLDQQGRCLDDLHEQSDMSTITTGSSESPSTTPHNEALNVDGAVEEDNQPAETTTSTGYGDIWEDAVDEGPQVSTENTMANGADNWGIEVRHVDPNLSASVGYQCGKIMTESGEIFAYSAWGYYCSHWHYSMGINSGHKPLNNFLQFSPDFQVSGNITLTGYEELGNEVIKDLKYERFYMKHNPNPEEPYSRGCVKATEFSMEYLCLGDGFLYFSQSINGTYDHKYANLAAHATRLSDDDCDVKKETLPTFDGQQQNQQHHMGTPVSTGGQHQEYQQQVTTDAPIGGQHVTTSAPISGQQQTTFAPTHQKQVTVPGKSQDNVGSLHQETYASITSSENKHPCDPSKANHRKTQQEQQYQGSVPGHNPTQPGSLHQMTPVSITSSEKFGHEKSPNHEQYQSQRQQPGTGVTQSQHQHQKQQQPHPINIFLAQWQGQSQGPHGAPHPHCHHGTGCHNTTGHETSSDRTYGDPHPANTNITLIPGKFNSTNVTHTSTTFIPKKFKSTNVTHTSTTFIPQKFNSTNTTHTGEQLKTVSVSDFVKMAENFGSTVKVTNEGGKTKVRICTKLKSEACFTYNGDQDGRISVEDAREVIDRAQHRAHDAVRDHFTNKDTQRPILKAITKAGIIEQITREINEELGGPPTLEAVKSACGKYYEEFKAQKKEYNHMRENASLTADERANLEKDNNLRASALEIVKEACAELKTSAVNDATHNQHTILPTRVVEPETSALNGAKTNATVFIGRQVVNF
ncbi:hypothetical protein IWQ61_002250 [Dispira simplex]|nr:hypothetical protein IWQ61_002250 [Dispira simplex]